MNNRIIAVVKSVLAVSLLVASGCGDDESDTNNRPNPVAVITVATDLAVLAGLSLSTATFGEAGLPPVIPTTAAPSDTVFPGELLCPIVETTSDSLAGFLSLDYGEGCTSDLDGLTTTGMLTFTVTENLLGNGHRYFTEFEDFSRGGRNALGGLLNIEERGVFVDATASLVVFTGASLGGTISTSFSAQKQEGAGVPAYCRTYTIGEGSGSMTIGNFDYAYEVLETLVVSTCCAYPLEGLLSVTGAGLTPAFIDFGDGTCDSLATLTVGSDRQDIVMGY